MTEMEDPIDTYVEYKKRIGAFTSISTERNTRFVLNTFDRTFWKPIEECNENDVATFLADYRRNRSPSTVTQAYSVLRAFFSHLHRTGEISVDPMVNIVRPPQPPPANRSLTREQVELVRQKAKGPRAQLIFSLLYGEGLRVGEVVKIRVDDLGEDYLLVRGKGFDGNVSRRVALCPPTRQLIPKYLKHYGISDGYLIRSGKDKSQPAKAKKVGEQVSRWMAKSGVKTGPYDGFSAHALRHTAAQEMMEASDLVTTAQFLGHSNISTTSTYLRRLSEGQPEAQASRFAS